MQTLTLIRGLPGSGKSTLAKTLPAQHVEADMYFVGDDGVYRFNRLKLKCAHSWCQERTEQWLKAGRNVVVSNTFIQKWEMDAYRQLARRYNVKLIISICRNSYSNIHGVDEATLARMRRQWQE